MLTTNVGMTENVFIRTLSSNDTTDEDDAKVEFFAPTLLDDHDNDEFQVFCSALEKVSHTVKITRKRTNVFSVTRATLLSRSTYCYPKA